ncbi:CapA family protein [Amycolatopsis sp. H20-H5]|nr:CapA family protein [Amycolatopsis sp. H20-H5]MEC3980175.1 CapA family protein [Amycolatopsis sp. H20-H5]
MIKLLLGGDVNIQGRTTPAAAFRHLLPLFQAADLRFVNLEGPLSGSAGQTPGADIPHKPNWTHADPTMVAALTAAGIDVVSCANNVTYPPSAAMASLGVLDKAGIAHCGAVRISPPRTPRPWPNTAADASRSWRTPRSAGRSGRPRRRTPPVSRRPSR